MEQLYAIQKALGLIEQQLTQPLPLETLSRRVGMSLWHFQRTFTAMVGEPVGGYIRRRRITEAARRLRTEEGTILDVALDYQFESHEAFTRAFKAEMQVTPSAWRSDLSVCAMAQNPIYVTAETLNQRYSHMTLVPEIITLPPRTFIGLQARFITAMSPDSNNLKIIPQLWDNFMARIRETPSIEPDVAYGLADSPSSHGEKDTRPDEILYLASVQVNKDAPPPRGMVMWSSPGGAHAKFIHRGKIAKIGETMGYIYGKWLPGSGYESGDGPDIERCDSRFNPQSDDSILEIFIPIAAKK